MRHIILRLPGEANPEFIYMTPFTPRGKDNLAAWMAARMDGANYGRLVVYRFPKQSLVYGPKQIVNRINQETSISQQITLWDQKGSQVIRGELLVIPIKEALVYVQPLYLRAEGGKIPELKRVVVAHENRVAMGETLEDGLSQLFGDGAPVAHGGRRGPIRARSPASLDTPDGCRRRPGASGAAALRSRDRGAAHRRLGDLRSRDRPVGRGPYAVARTQALTSAREREHEDRRQDSRSVVGVRRMRVVASGHRRSAGQFHVRSEALGDLWSDHGGGGGGDTLVDRAEANLSLPRASADRSQA